VFSAISSIPRQWELMIDFAAENLWDEFVVFLFSEIFRGGWKHA